MSQQSYTERIFLGCIKNRYFMASSSLRTKKSLFNRHGRMLSGFQSVLISKYQPFPHSSESKADWKNRYWQFQRHSV